MPQVMQGPKSDAERIRDRLKGSNDASSADTLVQLGTGPTRIVHSVHRSGQNIQHGPVDPGVGDISGGKR